MDREKLKEKLIPFRQKCEEKGKPLVDLCVEDAYPGDSSTSFIVKVKALWKDDMDCSEALDFLIDTLFETSDEETRKKVFSIQVIDSTDELSCWQEMKDSGK
jgi:hypothetical protein